MDSRRDSPNRTLTVAPVGRRLLEYALIAGMFVGSMALWVLVPFGSLWLASHVSDSASTVMLTVLIVCPIAMLVSGLLLGMIYRTYLRLFADEAPRRDRSAWLGSLSGDRRAKREPRPVLDTCMTVSALTAIVLLITWFLFLAENYAPAGPVP